MFEHLDDPNPPSPTPERKRAVIDGVDHRRRERGSRIALTAAFLAVILAGGGAWVMSSTNDTTTVTTRPTDTASLTFCQAAQQIESDHQHTTVTANHVIVPNFDSDYAALTEAATNPDLRQALHDAAGLLAEPGRPPQPLELHGARIVQEALVSQCDLSTTIFGLIVNRTTVTLPAPTSSDMNTFQFALVGFTEAEAQQVAKKSGWTIRVLERDGQFGLGTRTQVKIGNRINVSVQDGIVVAIIDFG